MQTIFSRTGKATSNAIGGFLTGLTSAVGNLTENACFGDKACQENRAQQSQAQLLQAQAQLVNAQAEAEQAKTPWGLIIGGAVALLVVGGIILAVILTRKKA